MTNIGSTCMTRQRQHRLLGARLGTTQVAPYCADIGDVAGVGPKSTIRRTHIPRCGWHDADDEMLGRCAVDCRDGMRRSIQQRHSELKLMEEV